MRMARKKEPIGKTPDKAAPLENVRATGSASVDTECMGRPASIAGFRRLAVAGVLAVAGQIAASGSDPAKPFDTTIRPAPSMALAPIRPLHLQVLLARANFSPGLIDDSAGRKTQLAMQQFQAANRLTITTAMDEATQAALRKASNCESSGTNESLSRPYRITATDLAMVTGPIPTDWMERSTLQTCGYADLRELLAERGWCSEGVVSALNPGVDVGNLHAGDEVVLPDVPDWRTAPTMNSRDGVVVPKVARLEIDLTERLVKGFDAAGTQVLLMHCSIARSAEKRPVGTLKVKVVAIDPEYTFDPKDWPEVTGVDRRLRIAPGPRNPVGAAWIGLDKTGYGIHGTVRPQEIGKTGSHGCFRLTNWDAARLARMVNIGMAVAVRE
jgi:hypothetical protein